VQALVFSAALCPVRLIGEDVATQWGGENKPIFSVYSRNVAPGNCASLPGLVLPGGLILRLCCDGCGEAAMRSTARARPPRRGAGRIAA